LSLTLREGYKLKAFEDRVLSRIFVLRGRKWLEGEEDCIMRNFTTCALHLTFG
jgi:hypothetical protein